MFLTHFNSESPFFHNKYISHNNKNSGDLFVGTLHYAMHYHDFKIPDWHFPPIMCGDLNGNVHGNGMKTYIMFIHSLRCVKKSMNFNWFF